MNSLTKIVLSTMIGGAALFGAYQYIKKLEEMINTWLDHYIANGESHYSDTPDWKIRDIYWDKIVDRVLSDLDIDLTDEEIEKMCDRLNDL